MAFILGNFSIDEILYGVAEGVDEKGNDIILYTLDQLSSASIEISSESTDITDKKGNIVRTIYKTKTGTFTATNAFLHPQILAATSAAEINKAAANNIIKMPRIDVIPVAEDGTNASRELTGEVDDQSVQVVGVYGSGACTAQLEKTTGAVSEGKYTYDNVSNTITVPAGGKDLPVKYLVIYDREITSGYKITNSANVFPQSVKLTLFCSFVDPCSQRLRACYVVLPSFQTSPETTISLSSDEQTMDFNGNLQIDYCSADQALYYIYFPDEEVVRTGASIA